MIFFPDNTGKPDYSCGFYINSKSDCGIEFLKRIWQYFWDKGEIVEGV